MGSSLWRGLTLEGHNSSPPAGLLLLSAERLTSLIKLMQGKKVGLAV